MKKLLSLFLVIVFCFGLVACNDNNSDNSNKSSNNTKTDAPAETGEVVLTPENVYDYLAFEIELENIVRYSLNYAEGVTEGPKSGFGGCDIVLNVFAKKAVTFDDVKITFDLVPGDDKFETSKNHELQLKYDGSANETYKYNCEVDGEGSPNFEVVVKEISGKVITK